MEAYVSLARKWRPKCFADVVGQDLVRESIKSSLVSGNFFQSILLSGTRGVGKTTIARLISKFLVCENTNSGDICMECKNCLSIDNNNFIDLIEIDAASNTQVEKVRELIDNTQYLPVASEVKIYIIDEVHMLSKSSFNALLKTIEEPPKHVFFVFATTEPKKIPETILSRCLHYTLSSIDPKEISNNLKKILNKEKITYDDKSIELLSKKASGSIRDSLTLLEQAINLGNGKIDYSILKKYYFSFDNDDYCEILKYISNSEINLLTEKIDFYLKNNLEPLNFLKEFLIVLYEIILSKHSTSMKEDGFNNQAIIKLFTYEDLQLFYEIILKAIRDFYYVPDNKMSLMIPLLQMISFKSNKEENMATSMPLNEIEKKESDPKKSNSTLTTLSKKVSKEVEIEKNNKVNATKKINSNKFLKDIIQKNSKDLGALEKILLQNSEIKLLSKNELILNVDLKVKTMINKSSEDKIIKLLNDFFNNDMNASINYMEITNSLIIEEKKNEDQNILASKQSIEKDTEVKNILKEFNGELIENTIKPNSD